MAYYKVFTRNSVQSVEAVNHIEALKSVIPPNCTYIEVDTIESSNYAVRGKKVSKYFLVDIKENKKL